MLNVKFSTQFRKSYKRIKKHPEFDEELFQFVVTKLAEQKPLDTIFRDHELSGNFEGVKKCRECHLKPDWLLIYKVYENDLVLYLIDTGTHSDLF